MACRSGKGLFGSTLRASLLALVLPASEGSSMYLAKLCRNFACHQAEKPLMDYDPKTRQCVCREHPCWDDNGETHHCRQPGYPHLAFSYTEQRQLSCTCSSIPHYGSVYIAHDVCPGHRCDKEDHPILDWDEDKKECVCRSHPCWSDKGERHECKVPTHPVLRFREEVDDSGEVRAVCECFQKLESKKSSELPDTGMVEDEYMSPDYYDDYEDDDEF